MSRKTHLHRSDRSTWCGLDIGYRRIPLDSTRTTAKVTCKTCLKADAAEQRKQDKATSAS